MGNIKPININTKNLTSLIEKINPKAIWYDVNNSDKSKVSKGKENETDHSYNKNPLNKPSSQNDSHIENEVGVRNKNWSRQESNFSNSTDERKNMLTPKVPKPRRVEFGPILTLEMTQYLSLELNVHFLKRKLWLLFSQFD